jgi:hypothetical protein
MAEWSLLIENATPPNGTEQWAFIGIPGDTSHLAYAIRAVVPDITPQSWNTVGFFGLFQVVEERLIMGRTYPIPLVGRGDGQVLRYIGSGDIDLLADNLTAFGVVYYINKWVDASAFQVWVLS